MNAVVLNINKKIARGHISKSIRRTRLKFSPRESTTTITLCAKFNRNLRCRVLFRDFFGRSVVECPSWVSPFNYEYSNQALNSRHWRIQPFVLGGAILVKGPKQGCARLMSRESTLTRQSPLTQMSRVRVESTVKIKGMSRVRVEWRWSSFESELS